MTSVVGKQISVLGLGLSEVLGPRNIIIYNNSLSKTPKAFELYDSISTLKINFRWG